jgi:phosphatidylglycerophosphatase C
MDGNERSDEASGQRVVLFDFDGVLFRKDAFTAFAYAGFRRARWRVLLAAALSLPVLPTLPFTRKLVVRAWVKALLLGQGEAVFRQRAAAFGRALGRFHRDGFTALRRHLNGGDRVLVVTGCEHTLVTHLLDELGLGELEVIASRFVPGWLGMTVASHNVGAEKLRQLAARGLAEGWDVAYSDSLQDLPMLRAAREPVLINAKAARSRAAERALGRPVARLQWF